MLARLRRPKPNTKTKLLSTKLQSVSKLAATGRRKDRDNDRDNMMTMTTMSDGDEGDDDGDDDDEQRMLILEAIFDTEK